MTAMDDLRAYLRETEALAQVMGRLGWDQETVMPSGAAPQRAEEMAALEGVLHARRTDARIADWLASAEPADDADRAILRVTAEEHARATRVPARLAAEIARVTSLAQGVWAEARAAEDVAAFLPMLAEVVRLRREEGAALGGDPYDALLQGYEPGATSASLSSMFAKLRPRLVALRDRVRAAGPAPDVCGTFAEAAQLALSSDMALTFGYDLDHGRIDKAVHPFSSGSGLDVRITTRTSATDPFNSLYSTIHEVGHATYEQSVDRAYLLTPLGQGASMGVHESQSRIYENQLGRSPAFCQFLYGRMRDAYGDLGVAEADFARAVNAVQPGFIRTEADEVQYNLHILMRFDLEQALMRGDLAVGDLEAAWNDRFAADFGYAVERPSDGMLQDVHWSGGLFGYFPTYTLGNVYAGELHAALRAARPILDDELARGDLSGATGWLRENVQRHGRLRPPAETIAHAVGHAPGVGPLLDYLDAKFAALYRDAVP